MPDSNGANIHGIVEWIQSMAERGVYNATTARLRNTALRQITSILAPNEFQGESWLLKNLDSIANRWATKNHANPETRNAYARRVKAVVEDYLAYMSNPGAFNPNRRSGDMSDDEKGAVKSDVRERQHTSSTAVKLPTSSYDEICKIIRGYSVARNGDRKSLSAVTGVAQSTISENNGFLESVGLITGGKPREATSLGRRLGQALSHDLPTEISSAWRVVVEGSDFLTKMVMAVKIRKGMDMDALQSHIAYSAGVPKTARAMTGAKTVANILVAAGLIREDGGNVAPVEVDVAEGGATESRKMGGLGPLSVVTPSGVKPQSLVGGEGRALTSIVINLEVRVDVKPDELPALADSIKKMLKKLEEQDETASGGDLGGSRDSSAKSGGE